MIAKFESSTKPYLTISFKYLIENVWQTNGNKYIMEVYNKLVSKTIYK